MANAEYRSNGAVTGAAKRLIDAPAIQVRTTTRTNGMIFHTVVFVEPGEQRDQIVERLTGAGWSCKSPAAYDTFVSFDHPLPEH